MHSYRDVGLSFINGVDRLSSFKRPVNAITLVKASTSFGQNKSKIGKYIDG